MRRKVPCIVTSYYDVETDSITFNKAKTPKAGATQQPSKKVLCRNSPFDNPGASEGLLLRQSLQDMSVTWQHHQWLEKHGKHSKLQDKRQRIRMLQVWFTMLDVDGSGTVGLDELGEPLVSVGLASSRNEVARMIEEHGFNTGEITFEEFLTMLGEAKSERISNRVRNAKAAFHSSNDARLNSNPVITLFENLNTGKLGDKTLMLPTLIAAQRRHKFMDAHLATDSIRKSEGLSVLNAAIATRPSVKSRKRSSLFRSRKVNLR